MDDNKTPPCISSCIDSFCLEKRRYTHWGCGCPFFVSPWPKLEYLFLIKRKIIETILISTLQSFQSKKKNQKYMWKYNITYSKWYNKNFCKYLEIWNNILVRRQWHNLWDLNSKTWICILALHLVALGSLPKFSSVKLVWYLLNIIVMIKRSRAYGKY